MPVDKRIIDNAATSHIVSGCIGIIKSSQQSTVNSQQSTVNSQQSTVNSQQSTVNSQQLTANSQQSTITDGTTGIDVMFAQSAKIVISSKDAIATSAFSK